MKVGIDYALIYAVYCIVSGKWYIGQTTRTFEERKKEHIYDSFNLTKTNRHKYNCAFHCAIRKYGIENFIWFVIEDNIPVPYHFEGRKKISDYTAADEREIYWIADKNSYEHGYNMTKGGHDTSVVTCVPICQYTKDGKKAGEYESVREASRLTGIPCGNISGCLTGKYKSAGEYLWKYASDDNPDQIESFINNSIKSIYQYTKDGILVGKYESITEASRQTGIGRTNISLCLIGKNKSAGDYLWKYASDDNPEQIKPFINNSIKSIYQYNKDGKQVGCYESISEASRQTEICRSSISNCLIGKYKSAGGYGWAYAS